MTLRQQVLEFHAAFEIPLRGVPDIPTDDEVRLRLRLIAEEFFELLAACLIPTDDHLERGMGEPLTQIWNDVEHSISCLPVSVVLPAVADALADLDYVVEGARLVFGIDGAPIAAEVHRTNMAKVGSHGTRSDGKITKPEGWKPPDIEGELRMQGWKP